MVSWRGLLFIDSYLPGLYIVNIMVDPKSLWRSVIDEIDVRMDSAPIKAWLAHTEGLRFEHDVLTVGCKHTYTRDFLRKNSEALLQEILANITKREVQLAWEILTPVVKTELDVPLFEQKQLTRTPSRGVSLQERISQSFSLERLNSTYTLDRYVVGSSNRVAYSAAQAVIENPGLSYNPLFIYGGTGVGKTHLMHSIGNGLKDSYTDMRVIYFTTEQFLNDFVEFLRQKKNMMEFRNRYRSADCILVDDIQFLGGKEGIQEEFYHTFNHLYQSGKQIILASDTLPDDISNLADRLASRFKGGLMVDINPPDYETRFAIIQAKSQELGMVMATRAVEMIADIMQGNIREIEGTLLKIKSELVAQDLQEVDIQLIQQLLGERQMIQKEQESRKKLTPELILGMVMDTYGVDMKDLCGKRRKKEIVIPRQLAMFMLRDELGMNYMDIGRLLGGRDHTTIMHGFEQIRTRIEQGDKALQSTVTTLRKELYG